MTCGYVCPQCEGNGITAEGEVCDWCTPANEADNAPAPLADEDWIKAVHEGKCCADE